MFNVENLYVYHTCNKQKNYLLKDICFSLNKGDSLGIIGKSGEGKSTLAKALLKIYDNNVSCEKGNITLDGEEISNSHRGIKISLLFQNPNSYLNPLMKVGKQIQEMLIFHYKEDKKVAKLKTIKFMKNVGIENPEIIYSFYPHEISGGMQQRICLCIALICNPDILILDECTSYLDKENKFIVLNLIKKLQKEYNFSLIMISHDFKEIYNNCNKIAIMHKGCIVELGDKDDIISKPMHPYTFELLNDYLRYHKNVDSFKYESENELLPSINFVACNHYVRYCGKADYLTNFNKIKEVLYETLRN